MKKLTAIVLTLAAALSLAACSENSSSMTDSESAAESSETHTEESTAAESSETSETTTEPAKPDPYPGMVKLDLGETYCGYDAFVCVPKGKFEKIYSGYDTKAAVKYQNKNPKYEIGLQLKLVNDTEKNKHMNAIGYVLYGENDKHLEGSQRKYDFANDLARYYFYIDGPDGSYVELYVTVDSLSNEELDDEECRAIVDTIGKTATIEGSYEAPADCEDGNVTLESEEGLLAFSSDEITLNGTKAALTKEKDSGTMRISAVTENIDGKTYTVRERGLADKSMITSMLDDEACYTFRIGRYKVTGRLNKTGDADYIIRLNDYNRYLSLTVFRNGASLTESLSMYNDAYDDTKELFDALLTDYIKAAEVKG